MSKQNLQTLLQRLGQTVGIADLALDDDGYCLLRLDGTLDIAVEFIEDAELVVLTARCGALGEQNREAVLQQIADANFWLGEAQYSQGKFNEAAKTFLNAYKTYGKSEKAPEMLLKLAMSLAALDSRDTACATLREVAKAYPKASRAIITKVATEQKRLSCGSTGARAKLRRRR